MKNLPLLTALLWLNISIIPAKASSQECEAVLALCDKALTAVEAERNTLRNMNANCMAQVEDQWKEIGELKAREDAPPIAPVVGTSLFWLILLVVL